mmetsp:Transcript_45431/g.52529  ORF Transcript_45431/g.52529 Transcript_45431/m.52529 type:complete len:109 (+) Transcript_45431:1099-1425(+)
MHLCNRCGSNSFRIDLVKYAGGRINMKCSTYGTFNHIKASFFNTVVKRSHFFTIFFGHNVVHGGYALTCLDVETPILFSQQTAPTSAATMKIAPLLSGNRWIIREKLW